LTAVSKQRDAAVDHLKREYDQAISLATTAETKAALIKRRDELTQPSAPQKNIIVTDSGVRATQSAAQLDQRADVLLDSEDKVQKQLERVETHLAALERRSALLRHGTSAESSLFVEGLNRRMGSTRVSQAVADSSKDQGGGSPSVAYEPPPRNPDTNIPTVNSPGAQESPRSGYSAGEGGDHASQPPAMPTVNLRDVIDPLIFDSLKSGGRAANLQEQIILLRGARAKLRSLSAHLKEESEKVRQEAKQRRDPASSNR
jgi:hypothetical protein